MDNRILLLGASGFLGNYLYSRLSSNNKCDVLGTFCSRTVPGFVRLDMTNFDAICSLLLDFNPTSVVFLAGTKDVAKCEQDPAFALDVNVHTVRNFIAACHRVGVSPFTLFFSTDYVFDGITGYYTPDSQVGPRTVYGLTNLLAERMLANSGIPGIILRVSAVMGRQGGFFRWLYRSLECSSPISLFTNTYFSPTSIGTLCEYVKKCVNGCFSDNVTTNMRICHLSDGFRMSRYDFGCIVANKLNMSLDLLVPSCADLSNSTFQGDLSLLPDDMLVFNRNESWDELGEIL